MERVCALCHAAMGAEMEGDWCPACGGALLERAKLASEKPRGHACG